MRLPCKPRKPISSAAQQVLCACISAVMRSSNTCCASGYQLMGDELLDISSVYVYERAVTAWYLQEVFAKLLENLMMKSIIL